MGVGFHVPQIPVTWGPTFIKGTGWELRLLSSKICWKHSSCTPESGWDRGIRWYEVWSKLRKTTHIYMASSYICGIFICHHISMINSWKKNCGNSPLKLNIASEKRPSHAPKGSRIISKKLSIFRCKLAVRFGEGNPWNLWPKGPAADRRTRTGSRTGSSFVSLGFWNIPTVILSPCKTYIPMKRNFCTTWTYLYRYNINTYIYTDL